MTARFESTPTLKIGQWTTFTGEYGDMVPVASCEAWAMIEAINYRLNRLEHLANVQSTPV